MSETSCPYCHRPYAPKLVVSGPVRQQLVDIIASRPNGVTRDQMMWLLYGNDPNGGPVSHNIVSVHVFMANKQLRRQGYEIIAGRGRGASYRLVQVHPVREERRRYRQQNAMRWMF